MPQKLSSLQKFILLAALKGKWVEKDGYVLQEDIRLQFFDDGNYDSAASAISRAFKRLELRGLIACGPGRGLGKLTPFGFKMASYVRSDV